MLTKTEFKGWRFLSYDDSKEEYTYMINDDKIRRQGDVVWFWVMCVKFQKPAYGEYISKFCYILDCGRAMVGLASVVVYDSEGKMLSSDSYNSNERDMQPIIPDSRGDTWMEHACSLSGTGAGKTEGSCMGTGWPVSAGFVVTNYHVVEGAKKITLIRTDGVRLPAQIASYDANNDLVLLKVEDIKRLPKALPVSPKPAKQGDAIITIGYPHPELLGHKPKLTDGVVNSTTGLRDDPRFLQVSVPIQAGNSGGPLVNMEGCVVGIVTSKLDAVALFDWTGDLPQNINYGIKASYLNGLLSSVTSKGHIATVNPSVHSSTQSLGSQLGDSILMVVAE